MSSQKPSVFAAAKHRLTAATSAVSVLPLVVRRVLMVETIVYGSTIHLRVRRRRRRLLGAGRGPSPALSRGTGDQPRLLPWVQAGPHRESRFLLGRDIWRPESLLGAARGTFRDARAACPHGDGRRLAGAFRDVLRAGDGRRRPAGRRGAPDRPPRLHGVGDR